MGGDFIGQYGWKIKNYKAATIMGKNMGVRDKYDYTDAVLHHSLFTRWLRKNGMVTDKKDESTRDIICIDFQFGLRSYTEEKQHIKTMRKEAAGDKEKLKILDDLELKVDERKDIYKKMSKDDIRREFYVHGVPITYTNVNKKTGEITEEVINYKMLYRNPSKAKQGSCMFIREELYEKAYDWLTMGIGPKLPDHGAKIVEISAYAPLSTSAIAVEKVGEEFEYGFFGIPIEDVLILKDQDSFFNTIVDVVKAEDYETFERKYNSKTKKYDVVPITKKKCVVERRNADVKNAMWDGMALIESDCMPEWCNGMALLRNHFFKACAFRTYIQKFFRDYCEEHSIDYETYELTDMFGIKHLAKDIKIVTTDNAIKWKKFVDLMGGDLLTAYKYWKNRVNKDGSIFGIIKSDHPSKLGQVQQLSYQMINSLPCTQEDINKIAQTSIDYVELLKRDNNEFEKFLRKNATAVNHYEMLADLYDWNHDFQNSKMWKIDKSKIINQYVGKLKSGKITVCGDNLTVCGSPYALLLYTVGEDWENDPTLKAEKGVIQVYTKRFNDGEYLCGIRNPHNSSNNLGYFKNVKHPLMEKYFEFSNNIMAVNCIHTDIQARMNGEDFDSDFNLVTNQPEMVKAAKIAYMKYPTVVNEIAESGLSYDNTMEDYAMMDSKMQSAQKAIGGSSDSAQLSQSYMFTKISNNEYDMEFWQLYHNTVILAVLAQVAIDGCKKVFEVDVNDDIKRIRSQDCMKKDKDYPMFMKWTHEIPVTKNGKERPEKDIEKDRKRIERRIDDKIMCPMNWLEICLDKIQGAKRNNIVDTSDYFINKSGWANNRQMTKIRKLIEEYDDYTKRIVILINENPEYEDLYDLLNIKTQQMLDDLNGIKISDYTMNRLIGTVLGVDRGVKNAYKYKQSTKYTRKVLNLLYQNDKEKFLNNFIKGT